MMPATMGMPTIPLPAMGAAGAGSTSALALAGGRNRGDGSIVARAVSTPGGGEAESVAVEGHNGLSHVEKLEMRSAEIMEQILGLASFCERAGASKELEVSVEADITRWGVHHARKLLTSTVSNGSGRNRGTYTLVGLSLFAFVRAAVVAVLRFCVHNNSSCGMCYDSTYSSMRFEVLWLTGDSFVFLRRRC